MSLSFISIISWVSLASSCVQLPNKQSLVEQPTNVVEFNFIPSNELNEENKWTDETQEMAK